MSWAASFFVGFNPFELEITIPNLSVPEFETRSQDLAAQICTALGREITNCHVISDRQNSDGSLTVHISYFFFETKETFLFHFVKIILFKQKKLLFSSFSV